MADEVEIENFPLCADVFRTDMERVKTPIDLEQRFPIICTIRRCSRGDTDCDLSDFVSADSAVIDDEITARFEQKTRGRL